jgi:uncharacterized membrane protein YagU involved in acid resistance
MNENVNRIAAAAVAGLAATLPMSAVMLIGHRLLPWRKRDPLPPAQITKEALKAVGLHDDFSHEERLRLTVLSHFGYGAAAGAGYGVLPASQSLQAAVMSGMSYGLAVWAASYLGWLPSVGLYRSAEDDPPERNALMIAAHLVWGGVLGVGTEQLTAKRVQRREAVL